MTSLLAFTRNKKVCALESSNVSKLCHDFVPEETSETSNLKSKI